MAGFDISRIKDAALRHAAENADLNDTTANLGKLDQCELSVFIKEAVKNNCDLDAIEELCNQIGVEHATDEVKASMEKLSQLQKLEKELEYYNNIIEKRDKEINKLDGKIASNLGTALSFYAGSVAVGAGAGAAIGSTFAGVGAAPGMFIGAAIGIAGGILGMSASMAKSSKNSPLQRELQVKKAPFEEKVRELETKMEKIQESL